MGRVMTRLWEVDHPYYCNEGNFYFSPARHGSWDEVHTVYDSWADFISDWGETDPDLNLVFRWDWMRGEDGEPDTLGLYWVLQRKAILRSTYCTVTEADEPAIREWLQDRAKTITEIWQPISLDVTS